MSKKPKAVGYEGLIRIIGGKWRGRNLSVGDKDTLRPTPNRVRETLFNWLQEDIQGARCLDLFAGTGILGFEALSRGANQVTFVEKDRATLQQIEATATKLAATDDCQLIVQDALAYLATFSNDNAIEQDVKPFDVIFLDPPFNTSLLDNSLIELAHNQLMGSNTLLYVESAIPLSEQSMPNHWHLLKQKQASQVFYHLIRGSA